MSNCAAREGPLDSALYTLTRTYAGVSARSALRTLVWVRMSMWPKQIGEIAIRAEVFRTGGSACPRPIGYA